MRVQGRGIDSDSLLLVGDRFCTSKCAGLRGLEEDVRTYGFRGEALASIREVGTLELTTRSIGLSSGSSGVGSGAGSIPHGVTMCKRMDHTGTLSHRPATTARPSHGTTVQVTNIFARWPVRRKALRTAVETDSVLRRVQSLALINNGISFTLINVSSGARLVASRKTQSVAAVFGQLFGEHKARCLLPLPHPSPLSTSTTTEPATPRSIQVHGYLGSVGHHSRELGFVYVNGRRCVPPPCVPLPSPPPLYRTRTLSPECWG